MSGASDVTLDPGGPAWPDSGGRPLLFLVDASSRFERRIIEDWIERNRPRTADASSIATALIPPSRRRRRLHRIDPRLEAFLRADDDALLVPMRVVWLASERDGTRRVGWSDLLTFGDPRDPDPVRQRFILRMRPDHVRVVIGEAARASVLRDRWVESGIAEGSSLGDFVALQAWLALERSERRLRGSRYKVPKFVSDVLAGSKPFTQGLARVARDTGAPFEVVSAKATRYLKEIAATHSPYVIDLMAATIRWLIDQGYHSFRYDRNELIRLYEMGQRYPLVFLPSHKSNFDHLVLQYALYENELPPNHTAGGINLNFFPVGSIIRRGGVFFIRRTFKDNETYKFVLRRYIDYLLEKRFSLEWYIEGGRSRSGKLLPPRFGLLSYVADSYQRGVVDDVVLIPVSIAYDQISDVGSYAAEQRGLAKEKESIGWLVRTIRNLRRRYGAIHLRFAEPISLSAALGAQGADAADATDETSLAIQKLAFQVSRGINAATPITPISLVALTLLSVGSRALTVEETMAALEPFLDYVKQRDLPTTVPIALDTPERVRQALDDLAENDVVTRYEGGTDVVYAIGPDQHLAAAYYRNTVVHFFIGPAIAEVALACAGRSQVDDQSTAFWNEVFRLRDLLKFDFFFPERDEFRHEIETELELQRPGWESVLAAGDVRSLLVGFRPLSANAVLRPFIEAYSIVADLLVSTPENEEADAKRLVEKAIAVGTQFRMQQRLRSAESVSKAIFEAAVKLAANRDLLAPDSDATARRRAFAEELRDAIRDLDTIDALVAGRRAGLIE